MQVRLRACRPGLNLVGERVQAIGPPGDQHEAGAPGGKLAGELGTDPRAGTCDQHGLLLVIDGLHDTSVIQHQRS
jgi:hypothetical protein